MSLAGPIIRHSFQCGSELIRSNSFKPEYDLCDLWITVEFDVHCPFLDMDRENSAPCAVNASGGKQNPVVTGARTEFRVELVVK